MYLWIKHPTETIEQNKFLVWVHDSYSKQFCTAIFPRISDCVRLKPADCPLLASKVVNSCIAELKTKLPDTIDANDKKTLYASIADCFQNNMHSELVNSYLVDSAACQRRMQ
jgi:hypothetical protein